MNRTSERMASMLKAAIVGAAVAGDLDLAYDEDEGLFSIGDSGVGVSFEPGGTGENGDCWRVIEIYESPDLKEGGSRQIGSTVILVNVGDEMLAAKAAIERIVSRRIDAALDAVA